MRTCSLCGTRQDISGSQWTVANVVNSWQSSARYCGSWPCNALYTRTAILKSIHCRTGNQCSSRRTGVICCRLPVRMVSRAAVIKNVQHSTLGRRRRMRQSNRQRYGHQSSREVRKRVGSSRSVDLHDIHRRRAVSPHGLEQRRRSWLFSVDTGRAGWTSRTQSDKGCNTTLTRGPSSG